MAGKYPGHPSRSNLRNYVTLFATFLKSFKNFFPINCVLK